MARSQTILPGSWTASGLRHGANAADNALVNPLRWAVRANVSPPAWDCRRRAPFVLHDKRESLRHYRLVRTDPLEPPAQLGFCVRRWESLRGLPDSDPRPPRGAVYTADRPEPG